MSEANRNIFIFKIDKSYNIDLGKSELEGPNFEGLLETGSSNIVVLDPRIHQPLLDAIRRRSSSEKPIWDRTEIIPVLDYSPGENDGIAVQGDNLLVALNGNFSDNAMFRRSLMTATAYAVGTIVQTVDNDGTIKDILKVEKVIYRTVQRSIPILRPLE